MRLVLNASISYVKSGQEIDLHRMRFDLYSRNRLRKLEIRPLQQKSTQRRRVVESAMAKSTEVGAWAGAGGG